MVGMAEGSAGFSKAGTLLRIKVVADAGGGARDVGEVVAPGTVPISVPVRDTAEKRGSRDTIIDLVTGLRTARYTGYNNAGQTLRRILTPVRK